MIKKFVIWYLKRKIEYYRFQIESIDMEGYNYYISEDTIKRFERYREKYLSIIEAIENTIKIL